MGLLTFATTKSRLEASKLRKERNHDFQLRSPATEPSTNDSRHRSLQTYGKEARSTVRFENQGRFHGGGGPSKKKGQDHNVNPKR